MLFIFPHARILILDHSKFDGSCFKKVFMLFYSFESIIPPLLMANVASFSGRSGLKKKMYTQSYE